MKFLFYLLLTLTVFSCYAQKGSIDLTKVQLGKLPFYATKAQIIQRLCKPGEIIEPHYECGSLSSSEQQKSYFSLHYKHVIFTGNAQEGYLLDEVHFGPTDEIALTYQQWQLSSKTTVKELKQIFGDALLFDADKDGTIRTLIRCNKADDGAMFRFKDDRLIEFTYWSPC